MQRFCSVTPAESEYLIDIKNVESLLIARSTTIGSRIAFPVRTNNAEAPR